MFYTTDRTFFAGAANGGSKGLKAARSIAPLSYRGYKTYNVTQQEDDDQLTGNYRAASYQNYQGDKLVNRFNAYSYWYLSKAMDSHNVGRGRNGVDDIHGQTSFARLSRRAFRRSPTPAVSGSNPRRRA